MAFSWGAAILGELGKVADVAFDAQRQAATLTPGMKRKANQRAAEAEEACTPFAVNAKIEDARARAKALTKKTG